MTAPAAHLPGADRRLGPYTILAVVGLVGAIVTGQAVLAAAAAPAGVLIVRALSDRRPLVVTVVSVSAPERLLEGDAWTLTVELAWAGEADVDVLHTGLRGSRVDGVRGWTGVASDGVTVRLTATAERWGLHDLGSLVVRARRPGGMLRWDRTVPLEGAVRVLPAAGRLDALLPPSRPRTAAGAHVAPVRGSGTDLAELRPYVPGDRLRDLSWTASARSAQPWVVVHHPERTATVVLLLDGFTEVGAPEGALDRAARAVWAVARHHLLAGDRVGLLSTGSVPAWLPPAGGRRARYQLLDALLRVGASAAGSSRRPRVAESRRNARVPADAVVLGVTPLQSDAFVATVVHHARVGHPCGVVCVRIDDLLPAPEDEVERAARRLWALDTEHRRGVLAGAGVPAVFAADDAAPAVDLLQRRMVGRTVAA